MKWTVGAKIGGGFALAVVALLIICLCGYLCTRKLIGNNATVAHTHQVLEDLEGILSILKDAETGQRGFIITGEPEYLQPFNPAEEMFKQYIQELRRLTEDNPHQKPRLDELETLGKEKFGELKHALALRKDKTDDSFHAAQQLILGNAGKQAMDNIRKTVAVMEDEERDLLKERNSAAEFSAALTIYVILIGGPLTAVALGIVGYLITGNISRPLGRMTVAADRIAAGDLSVKLDVDDRGDEVGLLSRTFVLHRAPPSRRWRPWPAASPPAT